MLKGIAARLPIGWQQELKRWHCRRNIKLDKFTGDEPEFWRLKGFIRCGDTCIDVGPNVGHYTRRMSQLVGDAGRVIAVEPISETFELLASNCADLRNVTLLNLAASNRPGEVRMDLPAHADSALPNYYRASITSNGSRRARAVTLDALVTLLGLMRVDRLKIDAEGADADVLAGGQNLLEHFRPTIIVEADAAGAVRTWLHQHDYCTLVLEGSPNLIAHHRSQPAPDLTQTDEPDRVLERLESSACP